MKISFLGDSHGFLPDHTIFPKDELTIHVGDLGLGFEYDEKSVFPDNFKFIRGNHDNPELCQKHPSYLGDFGILSEYRLAFIGGAYSKDRSQRIAGKDWWENEELSYDQFGRIIELIDKNKPDIIVSHDGPSVLFPHLNDHSVTRNNLNYIFDEIHRPKYWIYGHHHYSKRQKILGTEFIGLDINEFVSISI